MKLHVDTIKKTYKFTLTDEMVAQLGFDNGAEFMDYVSKLIATPIGSSGTQKIYFSTGAGAIAFNPSHIIAIEAIDK